MNDDAVDPIRYFTDVVRPLILQRIPGMEQLEVMFVIISVCAFNR